MLAFHIHPMNRISGDVANYESSMKSLFNAMKPYKLQSTLAVFKQRMAQFKNPGVFALRRKAFPVLFEVWRHSAPAEAPWMERDLQIEEFATSTYSILERISHLKVFPESWFKEIYSKLASEENHSSIVAEIHSFTHFINRGAKLSLPQSNGKKPEYHAEVGDITYIVETKEIELARLRCIHPHHFYRLVDAIYEHCKDSGLAGYVEIYGSSDTSGNAGRDLAAKLISNVKSGDMEVKIDDFTIKMRLYSSGGIIVPARVLAPERGAETNSFIFTGATRPNGTSPISISVTTPNTDRFHGLLKDRISEAKKQINKSGVKNGRGVLQVFLKNSDEQDFQNLRTNEYIGKLLNEAILNCSEIDYIHLLYGPAYTSTEINYRAHEYKREGLPQLINP